MDTNRTAHVTLTGEYDIYNCSSIERLLPPLRSVERVVIDCSRVKYMDTAALGVLVRYRRECTDAGLQPDITIIAPQGSLRKIFEIVGFVKLFNVVDAAAERTS